MPPPCGRMLDDSECHLHNCVTGPKIALRKQAAEIKENILRKTVFAGLALGTLALSGCVDSGTTYVVTDSYVNRTVTVINNSGLTITHFYGSNTGRSSWEEDVLGTSVIPAGSAVNINFNDGSGACMFDFKAVFSDGSTAVEPNVDVCRVSSVTVS